MQTTKQQRETAPSLADFGALGATMTQQAALWQNAQEAALDIAAKTMNGWLERRRQDLSSFATAWRQLSACGDLREAAEIQQKLLAGSVERLSADLAALAEGTLSLSQRSTELLGESGGSFATAAQRATSWVTQPVAPRRQAARQQSESAQ